MRVVYIGRLTRFAASFKARGHGIPSFGTGGGGPPARPNPPNKRKHNLLLDATSYKAILESQWAPFVLVQGPSKTGDATAARQHFCAAKQGVGEDWREGVVRPLDVSEQVAQPETWVAR